MASSTVVAVPIRNILRALIACAALAGNTPNVKLKADAPVSKAAASCSSNEAPVNGGTDGAGRPSSAKYGLSLASVGVGSCQANLTLNGANKLIPNGREVSPATADAAAMIWSGVEYAAPMKPRAPAFETPATSSGVSPPPAKGA